MKQHPLSRALVLALGMAVASPMSIAEGLPDLGEAAQSDFSPAMERRIGESIMLEIRRDSAYLDDPEISSYLDRLGNRLAAQSQDNRQSFEFFVLRDPTLNAFAMPGGYIGVHTGLILAAESESELASVLAHEISHVTQRHLARLINKSGQGQVASWLALAVAILAARSSPDLAIGAAMVGQGAAIQNQLNYSRDFEREADRVGLDLLERSDFDIRGMSAFFERLQKFSRLYETKNSAPGYLRTHPLTTERLADMGNRIQGHPYKQVPDSLEFQLVRAKLRAQEGLPRDAVIEFETRLVDRNFGGSEAAVRYGLALALLRDGKLAAAEKQVHELRRLKAVSPMIEVLDANLRMKQGDALGAVKILRSAQPRFPQQRAIAYALVEALLEARLPDDALKFAEDDLVSYPSDSKMHALQAKSYAMLGRRLQQHRAQAEAYALLGQLPEAVIQLELAQKSGDGNFYEYSQVDSRLREIKKRIADEAKQAKSK
jgi:predicted Zn-dependent protease